MGRTIASINADGDTTKMFYDALGRLTQTTDPLGHTEQYSYDLAGNMLSHTDANGNTTAYTYDAAGHLLSETDALNNITTYTYNADGELTSVTDANGNTTTYQYDAAGQLTQITFANGKTQQFWYDAAGNVTRHKDEAGNQTLMTYDANGNLLSRNYPDGSSDQYTYDLNDNMLTANNANANVTFTYDANGQVLSEQMYTTFNSQLSTLNYAYDTRNGIINITYPSGRQVTEQYDLRGRLSTILNSTDTIATFTYTPTDHIASRTYGNGDVTTFSYDAANRLTSINSINSIQPILSLHYSYDNSGNILSRIDSLRPNRSEAYGYDVLHRLTSFQRGQVNNSGVIPNPLKQVQYTLDALGNRISVTTDGTTTSYSHNNMNAYTTVGGQTIQYDNNGNMLSDGNHTYQYNYRNRMVSADNGSIATFQYDALDRRIGKMTASDTIHYFYRGVQCIEERKSIYTTTYIYGSTIDDIISMHRNNQDFYYHKNHLGSVVVITDSNGMLVETYDYDPYGTPSIYNASGSVVSVSAIGNNIMFTGREYDYETGFYYLRARTLHTSFGRFMQHDPLLYADLYDSYSYVSSNPIILVDNLGLKELYMKAAPPSGPVLSPAPPTGPVLRAGTPSPRYPDNSGLVVRNAPGHMIPHSTTNGSGLQFDVGNFIGTIGNGLSKSPQFMGISNSGNFYMKDFLNAWKNGVGGSIDGGIVKSWGEMFSFISFAISFGSTFGNWDQFQSMSDFWEKYWEWASENIGAGLGSAVGGALCAGTGPGAIVCGAAGGFLGGLLGKLFNWMRKDPCALDLASSHY